MGAADEVGGGAERGGAPVAPQGAAGPATVEAAAAAAAPCPAANGWSGKPTQYGGRASARPADAGETRRRERRRGRKRRLRVGGRAEEAVLRPRRQYQARAHASRAAMTTAAAVMGAAPAKAAAAAALAALEEVAEAGAATERRARAVR